MKVSEKYSGFTVTRVREIPEQGGTLIEMTHDKTGAGLCWMKTEESNKLFSIAFKTIPEDDTGVFHILEHSVLNGSDRYPVREPFVELLKSSMNTFLNAMTFPDKTVFPVSSRNEQDFLNLVRVYLDAVFAPRVLKEPNVFYQEGWHLEPGEGYKGVVFNEMKGALSSVDEVVETGLDRMLFPDSCYGWVSGGDPAAIPDLTYDMFCAAYRRFYHPSNSRIWLDGDLPIGTVLEILDEYLGRYERGQEAEITLQQPRHGGELVQYYEIGPEEEQENRAQLTLGKIICGWEDKEKDLAIAVLGDYLAGSNDAPLKKRILERGLGQDLSIFLQDGTAQEVLSVWVRNMDDGKTEEILQLLRDTTEEILEQGLENEGLEASLNRLAFVLKEPNEPRGLMRNFYALNAWLYGGDPALYLSWDETLASLREKIGTEYYPDLVREMLLDSEMTCVLRTLPSADCGQALREKEQQRAEAEYSAMTEEEREALLERNRTLLAWQQTPDTPEALATIPRLSLSEVSPLPVRYDSDQTEADGVPVSVHHLASSGIVYLRLYFSLNDLTEEELRCCTLLPDLLLELPTARHTVTALQRAVKLKLGSLQFAVGTSAKDGETETAQLYLSAAVSVLHGQLSDAYDLVREVLTETDFHEPARISENLHQVIDDLRQEIISSGHSAAAIRAQAHFSAQGALRDVLQGVGKYRAMRELAERIKDPAEMERLSACLSGIMEKAVGTRRLTMSTGCDQDVDVLPLLRSLPEGSSAPAAVRRTSDAPLREGIRIPARISFAVAADHLGRSGTAYGGSARVAAQMLTYGHLWNAVRVQGGAYGTGLTIQRSGSVLSYSFRDPDPGNAFAAFSSLGDALENLEETDLESTVIGTVSGLEPLIGPKAIAASLDAGRMRGYTYADACAERKQLLETTPEILKAWSRPLRHLTDAGAVCVIGYGDALEKFGGLEISDL